MGFWNWETMSSATETVKKDSPDITSVKNACWSTYNVSTNAVNAIRNNGPHMVSSAVEAVRKNSPDYLTPVKNAWWSTYNVGSKAVNAVKDNGPQMVKSYIPGPERIQKISTYVTHPATRECVKYLVPGATPVFSIAGALLKDKRSNGHPTIKDQKYYETVEAENERLKAELNKRSTLDSCNVTEIPGGLESTRISSQKPEDVISIFMMRGLNVKNFMDNQVVPIRGKVRLIDPEEV